MMVNMLCAELEGEGEQVGMSGLGDGWFGGASMCMCWHCSSQRQS